MLLLSAAAIFFVTEWLRADMVALLLLVALGLSSILTPQEAFSGFSRSAVVTIMAIFMLTAGLARTGATRALGRRMARIGAGGERRLIVVLTLSAAILSLFMNTIAAGAVLLPVATDISRERRISPGKLMMGLAFGAVLGGMATLLTTGNILVSAALTDAGYEPYGLLDFAPVGVPVVILGVAYMALVGHQLLPHRAPADWTRLMEASHTRLADVYSLRERWVRCHVTQESPLVGETVGESALGELIGVNVIAIFHGGAARVAPPPSEPIHAGDELLVHARRDQVETLRVIGLTTLDGPVPVEALTSDEIGMFEVTLAPRSRAAGQTLKQLHFREKYGLNVLAIWREGRPWRVDLADVPLQFGDLLLVLGPRDAARILQADGDMIVLTDLPDQPLRKSRMLHAALIMLIVLLAALSGVLSVAEIFLAGALAMVLAGALTMDEAYRSIEWKTVFLVAGMLPVGLALQKTGVAAMIGAGLVNAVGGYGSLAIMAALLILTTLLSQIMTGPATAVVLAPIAIQAAQQVGADPRVFALMIAYGSSIAFISPLSHPVNTLVMGPGGYRFADYLRVGAALTVLIIAAILILTPLVWGV